MPLKPRTTARTCATLVALCVGASFPAHAEGDGGVVLDAPRVLVLPNGHYDFNPPAFDAVDAEMRRLQRVEAAHKAEPKWATPVVVGLVVGFVAGAATILVVDWTVSKLSK